MALVTRKRAETVLVGLVALSLGILALIHRGVPAADVDLNDGGVWVTNQTKRLVGHLNHESQTIDGALRPPSSSFGGDPVRGQRSGAQFGHRASPWTWPPSPFWVRPGWPVC